MTLLEKRKHIYTSEIVKFERQSYPLILNSEEIFRKIRNLLQVTNDFPSCEFANIQHLVACKNIEY